VYIIINQYILQDRPIQYMDKLLQYYLTPIVKSLVLSFFMLLGCWRAQA